MDRAALATDCAHTRTAEQMTMKKIWMVVVGLVAFGHGAGRAVEQQPAPAGEAVLFAQNLMVPMRDGVRLATDIYRPAVNGVPVEDKLPYSDGQVGMWGTSYAGHT